MVSGLLLVDKPTGPTSHDVVSQARRALGLKKIGHSGTLDPMASGLLVLGVGQGTKLLTYLVGVDKTYQATIQLGYETVSDDAEGERSSAPATAEGLQAVTDHVIAHEVTRLRGEIDQVPSSVSAIKVGGKRSYQRVREGEEVTLAARRVIVSRFEILAIRRETDRIELDVEVECSSGTYIRALARDLGRALGVGGHLTALRRTRVGVFDVDEACAAEAISPDRVTDLGQAVERFLPTVELAMDQATELRHGRIPLFSMPAETDGSPVACRDSAGELVAIVRRDPAGVRILVGFPKSEAA